MLIKINFLKGYQLKNKKRQFFKLVLLMTISLILIFLLFRIVDFTKVQSSKTHAANPKPEQKQQILKKTITKNHLLTNYEITQLKLVGTIIQKKNNWALILAPDNIIYPITIGQYIGQDSAKVLQINTTDMKCVENIKIDNIQQEKLSYLKIKPKFRS